MKQLAPLLAPLVAAVFAAFSFTACITPQQYAETQEQLDYYKRQALAADSVSYSVYGVEQDKRRLEAQLADATREMEQLTATNVSLNRSYQDVLAQYNRLLAQNNEMLAVSSYEKAGLREDLFDKEQELAERERMLAVMEQDLRQKESALGVASYNYSESQTVVAEKNRKIEDLQRVLDAKEQSMNALRNSVNEALVGFAQSDLTVSERNGKMYLSLSQNLLFSSGSNDVDWKGTQALAKVAEALSRNPNIDIMVEGHTDTDGTAARNWDLSVTRATSVVRELTANGISPERITAAGRGFYAPVAPNDTAANKAKNRRTEIVLSPKLDELYNLIKP